MVFTKASRLSSKENAYVSKPKATLLGNDTSVGPKIARRRVEWPYITCSIPAETKAAASALTLAPYKCARLGPTEENGTTRITFLRGLRRPAYREIDGAALAAIDPNLADVPPEYIKHQLGTARN
ncbi:hypothetical protein M422DRAFT_256596, partial [Sphaerobolus stellatus SS14]